MPLRQQRRRAKASRLLFTVICFAMIPPFVVSWTAQQHRSRISTSSHYLRYYASASNLQMVPFSEPETAKAVPQHRHSRHTSSRRDVLLSSLLFIPIAASAASESTNHQNEPLENIRLGVGRWHPMRNEPTDTSSLPVLQTPYSPTFCTYAARFLIRYDANVNIWWTDLLTSVKSLNDSSRAQQMLNHNFGSFAKSLEVAFRAIPSSELYDTFVQNYGTNDNPEITRQIAILFTFVRAEQQPTSQLEYWYRNQQTESLSNSVVVTSDGVNIWQQLNVVELLPDSFRVRKLQAGSTNQIEFAVAPSVPMHDWWTNDDNLNDPSGIMTSFGPMGTLSLVRDTPHYSWRTYALLGVAGATSCALTHAVVIPLDGTRPSMNETVCLVSIFFNDDSSNHCFLLPDSRKNPCSNRSQYC